MKRIFITGIAGFIGFHLAKLLEEKGLEVTGIDNLNNYYDVNLKKNRLNELGIISEDYEYGKEYSNNNGNIRIYKADLCDNEIICKLIKNTSPDCIVNLAAQPGVRYSLVNPRAYAETNFMGFFNLIDATKNYNIEHFVYASSSSVYGLNKKMPYSTSDSVDHPVNIYAATKKSNELLAHTYSHLYGIPTTGLRFFTVYGPWGRPDMAYFLFAKSILAGNPINVFNNGKMERDFTYIDDIVEGIYRVIMAPAEPSKNFKMEDLNPSTSTSPYKIYNIGNNRPVKLMDMIGSLEKHLGIKAKINYKEMQPGDIEKTWANVDDLIENIGYKPSTNVDEGIKRFVNWYKKYYNV